MYAMDFATVGANIQNHLEMKGLTQQDLALKLGISKQVMNKIVKGSKAINVKEMAKIASILGTTTDELLTVPEEHASIADQLSFMGSIKDKHTMENIGVVRSAIDEIILLEELLCERS